MGGVAKPKKKKVEMGKDEAQQLLTCTLTLNRYKSDIREGAADAKAAVAKAAKAGLQQLPDGRPHSQRCLRQLAAAAPALERMLKDALKKDESGSESNSDSDEEEKIRAMAARRRRGGVTAVVAPSATWQFSNLQEVPMLRLLNVLSTQPAYVESAMAAKMLKLSEQYTVWCVEEVARLVVDGSNLTSMEQATAYLATLSSWADRQTQEQEAIQEDWENLTFEAAEHRRITMFTAYVARVVGYPEWSPSDPLDRGDGKGKKLIVELPSPVPEIDKCRLFDLEAAKVRRVAGMEPEPEPEPKVVDMPDPGNSLLDQLRPNLGRRPSVVSRKPSAEAEAALAALDMIDMDMLDGDDIKSPSDLRTMQGTDDSTIALLDSLEVVGSSDEDTAAATPPKLKPKSLHPAAETPKAAGPDTQALADQLLGLDLPAPSPPPKRQSGLQKLSTAAAEGHSAERWCKKCEAMFVGQNCAGGHPNFMYAAAAAPPLSAPPPPGASKIPSPQTPIAPPPTPTSRLQTPVVPLILKLEVHSTHPKRVSSKEPSHLASTNASGGQLQERWCKGCKAMFAGESCPGKHPAFMHAAKAPAGAAPPMPMPALAASAEEAEEEAADKATALAAALSGLDIPAE